jgi:hypothetical protein
MLSVENRTPLLLMFTVLPVPLSSPFLLLRILYRKSRSIGNLSDARRSFVSLLFFKSAS